ncbi:MAG: hypothetical protein LBD11_01140 [Candidatus Peribacteria bacterium]|nr:hypothetical protein [Candidatus Peribacteria bacterium]
MSYSTKELTTGSVIVTVTAVESGSFSFESGGRYTLDEGLSYSKTYIDNITGELVSFVNSGGDTFVRPIIITWIVPEVFLIYTPE